MNNCPICNYDYYNLAQCYWVCEEHLDTWIVTICDKCGKPSFSDCSGGCPYCYNVSDVGDEYARIVKNIRTKSRRS